jgi:hypothetical protein
MKSIILFIAATISSFAPVSAQTPSTPAPSTPALSGPVRWATPAPAPTPLPRLNLRTVTPIPAATVSQVLSALGFAAPLKPRIIVIQINSDGTAIGHAQ